MNCAINTLLKYILLLFLVSSHGHYAQAGCRTLSPVLTNAKPHGNFIELDKPGGGSVFTYTIEASIRGERLYIDSYLDSQLNNPVRITLPPSFVTTSPMCSGVRCDVTDYGELGYIPLDSSNYDKPLRYDSQPISPGYQCKGSGTITSRYADVTVITTLSANSLHYNLLSTNHSASQYLQIDTTARGFPFTITGSGITITMTLPVSAGTIADLTYHDENNNQLNTGDALVCPSTTSDFTCTRILKITAKSKTGATPGKATAAIVINSTYK